MAVRNVRRETVRKLFVERYPGKRTGNEVLAFYGWLTQNSPDLLPKPKHGDPYKHLASDLYGLWKDE